MKQKIMFVLVAMFLILTLCLESGFAQKEEEKAKLDLTEIATKLDQVLANQAQLFKQIDEIKQELKIIKVRATHR